MDKTATNIVNSKIEPEIFADELFGVIRRLGYKRFMALVKLIEDNTSVETIAKDFKRIKFLITYYQSEYYPGKCCAN